MLTGQEAILNRVYELADEFKTHFWRKEYTMAKSNYETACRVCLLLQVEEKEMMKIFGSRPYVDDPDDVFDGLFPEKMVQAAYWECIKKNQTFENARYPGIPKR